MALVVLILIVGFAVWHIYHSPPSYDRALLVLRVQAGKLSVKRGRIAPDDYEKIVEILAEESIQTATLALLQKGQVQFTGIPISIQQQLRNIIVNS